MNGDKSWRSGRRGIAPGLTVWTVAPDWDVWTTGEGEGFRGDVPTRVGMESSAQGARVTGKALPVSRPDPASISGLSGRWPDRWFRVPAVR